MIVRILGEGQYRLDDEAFALAGVGGQGLDLAADVAEFIEGNYARHRF